METFNTYYQDEPSLTAFIDEHRASFSPERVVLVQIFSGQYETAFLTTLSALITRLIPHAHVMGATTSGEIMNGKVSGLRTVLNFSVFYHSQVQLAFCLASKQDEFALGKELATKIASPKSKLLILFTAGLLVNAEAIMKGIHTVYPKLRVAGGHAGYNSMDEPHFVICGEQIIEHGAVGVVLEGDKLQVDCYCHLGWQPLGKEMTITQAAGLRVYKIDDVPAYQIYQRYLGIEDSREFLNVIEYPLIVERHGLQMARTPMLRYPDDSLVFAGLLRVGEKVRLSFAHVGMMQEAIHSLCDTIKKRQAEGIYVYSCEARRGFLQELTSLELAPLQKIVSTVGFFTAGEFFHAGGHNQVLNSTMTVVVLAEGDGKQLGEGAILPPAEERQPPADKVVNRSIGVLKALAHLVNSVTEELMHANDQLAYMSFHDALTGLYNRAFFEQQLKRLGGRKRSGVLICDLDHLKLLNDRLGHDAGDRAIQQAAAILRNVCRRQDMAARIGGDEFAIILAEADWELLERLRQRIIAEAARQRAQDPACIVYISVGIACVERPTIRNLEAACKVADADMYRHKTAARDTYTEEFSQKVQSAAAQLLQRE